MKHLLTGEYAGVGEEQVFEAASLYKLNLMYGAFDLAASGKVKFSDTIVVSEKAAYYYDDGEPTLLPGQTVSVQKAVECAIAVSDNTCAHALLEYLPVWAINQRLHQLGLTRTEIEEGTRTSAADMLRLLELIATGRAVSVDASRHMLGMLLAQQVKDRIPFLLPPGIPVAHKTGNLPGIRHDVGIVYGPAGPYIIAVLADGLPDYDPARLGEGSRIIAELSRDVFDYFAGRPSLERR